MRGVISLAAAIALPQTLANGDPFTQRNMIVFLTFSVILVTLVLQGLTLPPLIRGLGLAGASAPAANPEEIEARRQMVEAALAHLEKTHGDGAPSEITEELAKHYRRRLGELEQEAEHNSSPDFMGYVNLSRELLRVERQTAVRLRNQRQISDELLRELERELDLSETRLLEKRA